MDYPFSPPLYVKTLPITKSIAEKIIASKEILSFFTNGVITATANNIVDTSKNIYLVLSINYSYQYYIIKVEVLKNGFICSYRGERNDESYDSDNLKAA